MRLERARLDAAVVELGARGAAVFERGYGVNAAAGDDRRAALQAEDCREKENQRGNSEVSIASHRQ